MWNSDAVIEEGAHAETTPPGRRGQIGLRLALALLVVVGLGLVTAGLVLANRGPASGGSGDGLISLAPSLKVGQPAPDFQLNDVATGKPVKLSDLKGKPVWINFWATWCDACRVEMPQMKEAYDLHKDSGLVILGIDVQESPEDVIAYTRKGGYDWTFLIDASGSLLNTYEVNAIPTHWFVGRDGLLKATAMGAMPKDQLEANVAKIVAP